MTRWFIAHHRNACVGIRDSRLPATCVSVKLFAKLNVMRRIQVLILPLSDGFRAAASGLGLLDSHVVVGFRERISDAVSRALGSTAFRLEFTLSKDLKPLYAACAQCRGTEHIDIDGVFVQYMSSVYDTVDFSKKGSQMCPNCEGLGVEIPGFRAELASA